MRMRYLIYNRQHKLFQVMESKLDERNPFLVYQVVVIAKSDIDGKIVEALKKRVK